MEARLEGAAAERSLTEALRELRQSIPVRWIQANKEEEGYCCAPGGGECYPTQRAQSHPVWSQEESGQKQDRRPEETLEHESCARYREYWASELHAIEKVNGEADEGSDEGAVGHSNRSILDGEEDAAGEVYDPFGGRRDGGELLLAEAEDHDGVGKAELADCDSGGEDPEKMDALIREGMSYPHHQEAMANEKEGKTGENGNEAGVAGKTG